ncbi:MAG TPA: BtpA/SgcQ family protein [Acetobacteraceae bacterium]|nr:BtpA/SgcQ family protein [Acetobacteraceae bacterium]
MSEEEAKPVAATGADAIRRIFGREKVVIGVVHCLPLPGSPDDRGTPMRAIVDRALADADSYVAGGVDGLIVENHGDIPFLKPGDLGPETASCLAVIADHVRARFAVPLGINVLANGAIHAFAVAKAAGAAFIRVNQWANAYVANEGFVEGAAATALRYRAAIHAREIAVFADAHVKHGAHAIVADRPIAELVRDVAFFHADAVIATGSRTGDAASDAEISTIRAATHLPVLVGSGVTPGNVGKILAAVDGVIVASALKEGGVWWNPVEPARVREFMAAAKKIR